MHTRSRDTQFALSPLGTSTKGVFATLSHAYSLWRERQALARLDAQLLRDIGKSADEAAQEANRPVWDAPALWQNR